MDLKLCPSVSLILMVLPPAENDKIEHENLAGQGCTGLTAYTTSQVSLTQDRQHICQALQITGQACHLEFDLLKCILTCAARLDLNRPSILERAASFVDQGFQDLCPLLTGHDCTMAGKAQLPLTCSVASSSPLHYLHGLADRAQDRGQ